MSWFTFCCCPYAWPIAWCPLDHRAVDPAQPAAADVPEEKYCGALSVLIGVCCCPLGLIAACFPVDRRQNFGAMGFQAGRQLHHQQPRAAGHVQFQPTAHATNAKPSVLGATPTPTVEETALGADEVGWTLNDYRAAMDVNTVTLTRIDGSYGVSFACAATDDELRAKGSPGVYIFNVSTAQAARVGRSQVVDRRVIAVQGQLVAHHNTEALLSAIHGFGLGPRDPITFELATPEEGVSNGSAEGVVFTHTESTCTEAPEESKAASARLDKFCGKMLSKAEGRPADWETMRGLQVQLVVAEGGIDAVAFLQQTNQAKQFARSTPTIQRDLDTLTAPDREDLAARFRALRPPQAPQKAQPRAQPQAQPTEGAAPKKNLGSPYAEASTDAGDRKSVHSVGIDMTMFNTNSAGAPGGDDVCDTPDGGATSTGTTERARAGKPPLPPQEDEADGADDATRGRAGTVVITGELRYQNQAAPTFVVPFAPNETRTPPRPRPQNGVDTAGTDADHRHVEATPQRPSDYFLASATGGEGGDTDHRPDPASAAAPPTTEQKQRLSLQQRRVGGAPPLRVGASTLDELAPRRHPGPMASPATPLGGVWSAGSNVGAEASFSFSQVRAAMVHSLAAFLAVISFDPMSFRLLSPCCLRAVHVLSPCCGRCRLCFAGAAARAVRGTGAGTAACDASSFATHQRQRWGPCSAQRQKLTSAAPAARLCSFHDHCCSFNQPQVYGSDSGASNDGVTRQLSDV